MKIVQQRTNVKSNHVPITFLPITCGQDHPSKNTHANLKRCPVASCLPFFISYCTGAIVFQMFWHGVRLALHVCIVLLCGIQYFEI
jgi:hypothetical protein